MLKRTALMESISSNLHSFLKNTGENLPLTEKKFLRDSLIGLIRARQPVVCKLARHLPNQRTKFISRVDRLDRHLVKNSAFDSQVEQALPELWLPFIQQDTPIILDLSDIAKPLAKTMDYLATVRDGSTGQLVNGKSGTFCEGFCLILWMHVVQYSTIDKPGKGVRCFSS